jgi:hypothetical protein
LNSRKSPSSSGTPAAATTPPETSQDTSAPAEPNNATPFGATKLPDESLIGSPLKKHRASIYEGDESEMKKLLNRTGFGQAPMSDVLGLAEASQATPAIKTETIKTETEEEL